MRVMVFRLDLNLINRQSEPDLEWLNLPIFNINSDSTCWFIGILQAKHGDI